MSINTEEYKSILALIFAINEINKNPDILPNVTLGYHIFNTCGNPQQNLGYLLHILSGGKMAAPNYSCRRHGEVAGFIGDSTLPTSYAMAQILSLYRYTQINYQVNDPLLKDRKMFPTLHLIAQDEHIRYAAVIKCLLHFGWNWVGMVTQDDGSGDLEFRELSKLMAHHEICIEYVIQLTFRAEKNTERLRVIWKSRAEVVVICGTFVEQFAPFLHKLEFSRKNATLIFHDSWANLRYILLVYYRLLNCSLMFFWDEKDTVSTISTFDNFTSSIFSSDPLLEDFQLEKLKCLSSNQNGFTEDYIWKTWTETNCKIENYNFFFLVIVDVVVVGVVKVVMLFRELKQYQHQKSLSQLQTLLKCDDDNVDETVNIKPQDVYWKGGKVPKSRCNDRCPPGYRKTQNGGIFICCYDCIPCSEEEVSSITDSESCFRCPDEKWPDENRVRCVPRTYEFLSYENDALALILSLATLIFSGMTVFTLGQFIYFRHTSVVKANNRTVSFILLTSILLSFLCVFLFLGRPVDITCMLRQVSFGVFFTISVSCVLAKTVTVCIAFKATKPGSYWKKWVTVKFSNSLVVTCSFAQVVICAIWMSVSPPYQEHDIHSYPNIIIIQCNEGSVIGFYSLLGYIGFLAAVSFLLAFMVRTLPDSFNEAKYITFSMLVFCSVWIAMIPAYLSTRGKYMMATEIFAILTSCAGILSCIFFPKCYIMLLKPELNCRKSKICRK
ncbi:vomeronasal type-2 receptor 26-like [Hyperolius riggenbachi]|uniref:vomeronasal type-2 receptor 26-like n=1 Tax=Hyperolius riggenbachi TaxID=752182 RepID=UPI0035A375E7